MLTASWETLKDSVVICITWRYVAFWLVTPELPSNTASSTPRLARYTATHDQMRSLPSLHQLVTIELEKSQRSLVHTTTTRMCLGPRILLHQTLCKAGDTAHDASRKWPMSFSSRRYLHISWKHCRCSALMKWFGFLFEPTCENIGMWSFLLRRLANKKSIVFSWSNIGAHRIILLCWNSGLYLGYAYFVLYCVCFLRNTTSWYRLWNRTSIRIWVHWSLRVRMGDSTCGHKISM